MNCDFCGKTFDKKSKLQRHYESKTSCISTKDVIKLIYKGEAFFNNKNINCKDILDVQSIVNSSVNSNNFSNNINSNINSNNVTTINININSYDQPDVKGLKLISDLMLSWDQILFKNFQLIYMNRNRPENQSVYIPTHSRNDMKILDGDTIKVMSMNEALKGIENTIIELATNYVEDCKHISESEREERVIKLDNAFDYAMYTRDYSSKPRNISPSLYVQIKKQRKELIRKIRSLLLGNKENIELKKREKEINKKK